jgi:hypothetical protein
VQTPANIYVIGDTQHHAGVPKNPLKVYAWDIINSDPLPSHIVHLGDHWDFPSLSSYDMGKHSFDNENYTQDCYSGNHAMKEFWEVIAIGFNRHPNWNPQFIILEGNHENRRHKAMNTAPRQYLQLFDLVKPDYKNWHVVQPFLKPYTINDIDFVHYQANEFKATAIGTSKLALSRKHRSFVAGHKQVFDYAESLCGDRRIIGIIMGSSYYHEEGYRGPQNQNHFRGVMYMRNCLYGEHEHEVRYLKTLDKKYGDTIRAMQP